MKFFSGKLLTILMLASFFTVPVQADECCVEKECRPCCEYVCGCNPLYCGAFDIQGHIGVAPIIWADRGDISIIQCSDVPGANPIFTLSKFPRFHNLFRVPWIVGFQIGYAVDDNIRIYGEFNYVQAKSKSNVLLTTIATTPTTTIAFNLGKYKLFDAFIGAQYYFDRWCEMTSLFIGGKVGLVHHKRIRFDSTIDLQRTPEVLTTDVNFFNNNTIFAGGLNIGLDFCFCGCFSVVLTGEMVASCGPKANDNIAFGQGLSGCTPLLPSVGINNLLIGHVGTELRFPVTLGIRYSF
jgi:hypothetical protein